ncbi:MAG: EF-P beta-lysylation protein EpmB [Gammaproteobacteria bacterium]|nr:MAG: EF-P beta-lysylation protein EpmB [Gammaproteobacteria bacterium]
MIPRIQDPEQRPVWQTLLAQAVSSTDELLGILQIDPAQLKTRPLDNKFPLRVPRGFVQRMRKGDSRDPLLLQVLPVQQEAQTATGFVSDPLDELDSMVAPGLLHKYQGRALLTATGACAIHCRYCFRRHFPDTYANPLADQWQQSVDYVAQHSDITELILSGGDPLTLTDARLYSLTDQLAGIGHLRTLRIHSRLPVVLPERIDTGLLSWLESQQLKVVMVVHCNHANEIDADVSAAMQRLGQAGVTLLNQSVLLRDINDDIATLVKLSKQLFSVGVLPYYLHQLDKVQGAAHFEVDDATARQLIDGVSASLPGYLVPRLVREVPDMPGKTLL